MFSQWSTSSWSGHGQTNIFLASFFHQIHAELVELVWLAGIIYVVVATRSTEGT